MKKVIIIEDSPTFCNMLGKKLEAKGWKTILCYNYRDGLKAVKESSEWDVVISDMRLGNDNGIDCWNGCVVTAIRIHLLS
mgnify:CR=1 FL=1